MQPASFVLMIYNVGLREAVSSSRALEQLMAIIRCPESPRCVRGGCQVLY